ncbi:MAG: S8 family serine peptidase [Nanoarchaeota archaeon]|nr:S8 family serine peptidase [Nanoarchaeota archaeon]MBU1855194.1 S8 family serine peptidase [Nanoarchaeota archaeon]
MLNRGSFFLVFLLILFISIVTASNLTSEDELLITSNITLDNFSFTNITNDSDNYSEELLVENESIVLVNELAEIIELQNQTEFMNETLPIEEPVEEVPKIPEQPRDILLLPQSNSPVEMIASSDFEIVELKKVTFIDLSNNKPKKIEDYLISFEYNNGLLSALIQNEKENAFSKYSFPVNEDTFKFDLELNNTRTTVVLSGIDELIAEEESVDAINIYKDKIETIIRDEEFLRVEGYLLNDKIPVILSFREPEYPEEELIFKKENFESSKDKLQDFFEKGSSNKAIQERVVRKELKMINSVSAILSIEEIEALKEESFIKRISLDKKVQILLDESVSQIYANQLWGVQDSQGRNITGENVTIVIIDTGIDYTHTDLGGCLGAGCKVIAGYDFVNEDSNPMDDHGHGTHCAGIAASNGTLKGVAPNAKLVAYKVLNSGGSGWTSDIIDAIERSADPNGDGNYSDHYDIISMSLGGSGDEDDSMAQAVDAAFDKGVVVIVAAGNSGPASESIGSPGVARKALTIGATCKTSDIGVNGYCDEKIASFSSRGPTPLGNLKPDVVAPGVNICAAQWQDAWSQYQCTDDEHTAISGTSMATPHVSGAAALLLQAHPDWTPADIKSALMSTATDLGFNLYTQGTGEINLMKAYNASIKVNPVSVSFGTVMNNSLTRVIRITNLKSYFVNLNLSVTDVSNEENNYSIASINVSNLTISNDTFATILLNITLNDSLEGTFKGRINLNDGSINYSIPFTFTKLSVITVTVESDLVPALYPDLLLQSFDQENTYFAWQDSVGGNTYSFNVRSGNYTAYAIGDSEILINYILMDNVEVLAGEEADLVLNLEDARAFNVKAESFDGVPLLLYEWHIGLRVYNNTYYSGNKIGYDFHSSNYGNQTLYLSNAPNNSLNTDIIIKYDGIPTNNPTTWGDGWSKSISYIKKLFGIS